MPLTSGTGGAVVRAASARGLIVNADDFGADVPRTAGIAEAIAEGVVTSVSLLANGPALADAVRRLRALGPGVSVGVHLNLSEGTPVTAGLRRLVGPDDRFLGKREARRLLQRSEDRSLQEEVEQEVAAQVALLRDRVGPLRHLDGHQHVHLFPAVVEAAVAAAVRHAIPWVRIPEDPWPAERVADSRDEEIRAFLRGAGDARPMVLAAGLRATDHFRGLFLRRPLTSSDLGAVVAALPEGLTELMVHPGRAAASPDETPFSGFSTPDRELELEALRGAEFRAALGRAGVTLMPFPASD